MLHQVRVVSLADPGQGVQRQPQSHGRVAGHQVHAFIAQEPGACGPHRTVEPQAVSGLDRQHVAYNGVELLLKHPAQTCALHLVVQARVERVYVDWQAALTPQVVPGVFIGGLHVFVGDAELSGQCLCEAFGIVSGVVGGVALVSKQRGVGPYGLAVSAPVDVERPAGKLLTRIPLALTKVQKAALTVFVAQFVHQFGGKKALGGAQGVSVPFGGFAVVHGHKGGLAAHGQTHVSRHQFLVNGDAQLHHLGPLLGGVWLGHAGGFVNAGHTHVVGKLHFGFVNAAFNGGRTGRLRRAGQGDVAFACEQAGGGVQPDPACARQVNLAPGVQIREIDFGAAGAIQRLHIGFELNQVARHKTRGQTQVAKDLNQQPA